MVVASGGIQGPPGARVFKSQQVMQRIQDVKVEQAKWQKRSADSKMKTMVSQSQGVVPPPPTTMPPKGTQAWELMQQKRSALLSQQVPPGANPRGKVLIP